MGLLARRPLLVTTAGLLLFALLVSGLAYESAPGNAETVPTGSSYVIRDCSRLQFFQDKAEIDAYVGQEQSMWRALGYGGVALGGGTLGGTAPGTATFGGQDRLPSYSGTNVQVAGVDEDDVVKTDGTYVYTAFGGSIAIVRAYPPESAGVVARIPMAATGLFVDGDRLVALADESVAWNPGGPGGYYPSRGGSRTGVWVYDIADPANPVLVRNVTVDGSRVGARMYDGVAYVVASSYLYAAPDEGVALPTVINGGVPRTLAPTDVAYFRDAPYGGAMTNVLAVDIHGTASSIAAFLSGYVGTIYVSTSAIYLASFVYHAGDSQDSRQERTAIQRITFSGTNVAYDCSAEVPGTVLDQFSLDESEGDLRVATTVNDWSGTSGRSQRTSGVYVLDDTLRYLGSVENLAPGETIHSVRFVGGRGYVVTFKKIDPLFVVDLSDATRPAVLGELHIPGFSDYLHPWSADLLIGVGKDTVEGEGGNFAWYQGVQLSLFNVADPTNPQEVAKVVLGDRGSDSEVLGDHHAFLAAPEKDLIAFPVMIAKVDPSQWPEPVPDYAYGEPVWQGVVVYSVAATGFTELGRVTHGAVQGTGWEHYDYMRVVRRALYIEDVLYTVSDDLVAMNDLTTLAPIGQVPL